MRTKRTRCRSRMRAAIFLTAFLGLAACGGGLFESYRDQSVAISSQANFLPERYLGTWHEVARFPVPFERNCVGVTADYGQNSDGTISVFNTCRNADGSVRSTIKGKADIVGPGRLKVSFPSIPFVKSDYWVLWVDQDYRTAVVGAPNGQSGWILNRTPDISADRLQAAKDILRYNGYDLSRLEVLK